MPIRRPRTTFATALAASALLATTVTVSGPAYAASGHRDHQPRLTPRTHFTMQPDGSSGTTQGGEGIPNIDVVKSTIRTYYGAPSTGPDTGIADKESSPYISELRRLASSQWRYLAHARKAARRHHVRPAIVLDADDTTLWTYDMEDAAMHFSFDPTLQNTWVQEQRFPATPGMVRFVNRAKRMGFAIFGLTGRSDTQEAATLANLRKVGYRPFDQDNFFTKWSGTNPQPSYIRCATAKCTTVEYKAGTRRHIEKLGYRIVLNVGDQWSDLQGGHADKVLKLPNPTYYLPSPDLDGSPADRAFSPRTRFTMRPDGSSGATEGGEGIPNIDIVKSTIRTYYGAPSTGPDTGIADKDSSPYISELRRLTRRLTPRLDDACRTAEQKGQDPVVVLDADDTTLRTYDMEDAAMHFNFDPSLQNTWVQEQRFPATPSMVALTKAVDAAGCTLVGLTGRNDDQKAATLANLAMVGYTGFTPGNYYTKWTGKPGSAQPTYITCATAKCTTIEYKSQTRAHVADQGHRIVANLGDQFSDLIGGHADLPVKLPNPTYYLP